MEDKKVGVMIRFNKEEHEKLKKRVNEAGLKTINGYIRKMALQGYIIKLDLEPIFEPVKLISNISNNINQIAARVNATNNIYEEDVTDLKERYDELVISVSKIVAYIAKLED